jgi:predicted ribosome quality control (RQC) complex YloA/Tae2 family protein
VDNSCFIGNIRDAQVGNDAVTVMIDSFGKLGTTVSSRRFKKEIQPMAKASEDILALKPVTFHYKTDNTNKPQFGLIAEEVAEVNPDLVVRDKNGEIYTVRYDAVNAMLLNEFLKEHTKVEAQQATITDLQSTVAQQQKKMETVIARVEAQAAQIQEVSVRLEMNRPALQKVINP